MVLLILRPADALPPRAFILTIIERTLLIEYYQFKHMTTLPTYPLDNNEATKK
jgi:hypothetical protein